MSNRVMMYVSVDGKPSEAEDVEAPGTYAIEVDEDLSPEDRACAALDVFHDTAAVGVLDDFTFEVFDAEGRPASESDTREGYELKSRGRLLGRVDLPEPQASRMA